MSKNYEYKDLCKQINFNKFWLKGIYAGVKRIQNDTRLTPIPIQMELDTIAEELKHILSVWDIIQANNRRKLRNMYK